MKLITNKNMVEIKHILSKGFEIYDTIEGNDMGQMSYSLPQFKNDKYYIKGGYNIYSLQDLEGNELWRGWWKDNKEFDETFKNIENE